MTNFPHNWIKSRLGHGEWQCTHCLATNREIAVIGDPNHCPDAAAKRASVLVPADTQSVAVCGICDIADCNHIRAQGDAK